MKRTSVSRQGVPAIGALFAVVGCSAAVGAMAPTQAAAGVASVGAALPSPVLATTANVRAVSGRVLLKPRGSRRFVRLQGSAHIRFGSTLDTARGRVRVTIASPPGSRGKTQSMDFYDGRFMLTQDRTGLATAALDGGSFARCGRRSLARAARSPTIRKLWGSGKGRFRTRGRYAAATVRGTQWLTTDRCDGTVITVTQGSVEVTDLVTGRTVIVTAPGSFVVPGRGSSGFSIRGLVLPAFMVSNQPGQDMDVLYTGQPTFPLQLVADPNPCPPQVSCGHPRIPVSAPSNPLRFAGFWNCRNARTDIVFDYTIYLVDARGVRTQAVDAVVTCRMR